MINHYHKWNKFKTKRMLAFIGLDILFKVFTKRKFEKIKNRVEYDVSNTGRFAEKEMGELAIRMAQVNIIAELEKHIKVVKSGTIPSPKYQKHKYVELEILVQKQD